MDYNTRLIRDRFFILGQEINSNHESFQISQSRVCVWTARKNETLTHPQNTIVSPALECKYGYIKFSYYIILHIAFSN